MMDNTILDKKPAIAPARQGFWGLYVFAVAMVWALAGVIAWFMHPSAQRSLEESLMIWKLWVSIAVAGGLVFTALLTTSIVYLRRRLADYHHLTGQLLEQENRLKTFFNAAFEGIVVSDRGAILDVNSALEDISGYTPQELWGKQMLSFIHPDDRQAVTSALMQPTSAPYHVRIRHAAGHWADVEVRGRVQPDNPNIRLTAVRDISHIREHEQQLHSLVSELERSNHELEQFAYIASHDLQEPLRTVASYVGLLGRRYGALLDHDGHEFISFAVAGAQRMQALVQGLLEFSRVKTASQKLVRVEMQEVVDEVLDGLAASINSSEARISCSTSMPSVKGDRQQLCRLLQNLLSNALKYRPLQTPPQITLSCRRDGKHWLFTVEDNGIGVPASQAEKIFTIFHRLHTVEDYEGTGIGLAVSRRIIDRHHGRLWLDTDFPGPGARFCFTLLASSPGGAGEENKTAEDD